MRVPLYVVTFLKASGKRHGLAQERGSQPKFGYLSSIGPKLVWNRLKSSKTWTGAGPLSFLNDFEYKLGAEVLTPFGRQQLCESWTFP